MLKSDALEMICKLAPLFDMKRLKPEYEVYFEAMCFKHKSSKGKFGGGLYFIRVDYKGTARPDKLTIDIPEIEGYDATSNHVYLFYKALSWGFLASYSLPKPTDLPSRYGQYGDIELSAIDAHAFLRFQDMFDNQGQEFKARVKREEKEHLDAVLANYRATRKQKEAEEFRLKEERKAARFAKKQRK